jgi:hypothetical protein
LSARERGLAVIASDHDALSFGLPPEAPLNDGGGIALVIAALAFFTRYESKQVEPVDD